MDKRVLTIDRSTWRRGGDTDERVTSSGYTYLLNNKGFMCCLGFDAVSLGIKPEVLMNVEDPGALAARKTDEVPRSYLETRCKTVKERDDEDDYVAYYRDHNEFVDAAIKHNDASELSDEERERLIREDMIALGWDDVVFIN